MNISEVKSWDISYNKTLNADPRKIEINNMKKLNDVRKWALVARKHDWHYIIVVTPPTNNDEIAVFCKDFDDLHSMWHELLRGVTLKPQSVIRVNHDGTYEENLDIKNLE